MLTYAIYFRVHIDYAISIADWSTLRYRVAQRSPDITHVHTSQHTRVARRYRHEQCRPVIITSDCHLKGPCIRPLGDMVPPPPTPVKPPTTMSRRRQVRGSASWVARPAQQCRFHARCPHFVQSTELCRSYKFDPRQSTEFDQGSTSADPSNMHSPVCSVATSACYPYSLLTVQMMYQRNGCIMLFFVNFWVIILCQVFVH